MINHATSPKLYRSYYLHRSRDSLSPVCGIFFVRIKCVDVDNVDYEKTMIIVRQWCNILFVFKVGVNICLI